MLRSRRDRPHPPAARALLTGVHRLPPLPALPRSSARPSFPVIAVLAPLVGAVVIGLVTGSPFVLVFAVLSPLIAIATMLDARRTARRDRREELARFDRECRAYESAIVEAHALERAAADARHPLLGAEADARTPLRVGTGPALSATAPEAVLLPGDSADDERLAALIDRARQHPGLPVVVPRGPLALRGEGIVADALARRLALEPGVSVVRIGEGEHPAPDALLVDVRSATRIEIVEPDGRTTTARPEFLGRRRLAAAGELRQRGIAPPAPAAVRWADLAGAESPGTREAGSTAVPIGRDGSGVVAIDLERDGPHALVGGTTGSGKSEFLRTLALGWAAARPPSEVQLLFVDFKGGATFAGLTELPHAVGLVTDLDPVVAERALQSLRAELRRRERVLAEAGVRDITQRPGLLARLVVLVDEFAALLDAFPELHAPFADLSARGRSLGVHLVLCTQNPAGVVRDAVAANCAMRIAFRLSASAATGFLGAAALDASAPDVPRGQGLAAAPAGRGVIVTAEGARTVQIATIDDDDIEAVRHRWSAVAATAGSGPWLPPLPPRIEAVDLDQHGLDRVAGETTSASVARSAVAPLTVPPLVFGVLDDPAEQRRLPAIWDPSRDGPLAVLGAPRSGATTALAALVASARRAGSPVATLPGTVPEAWEVLDQLAEHPLAGGLLIADDLEPLLADAADLAPELLARWDAAVRAQRRAGGSAAAALGPATAARALLGARFPSRLVLRCLDADDHLLAGAPRGLFDRSATAGRGWWADRQVQVVAAAPAELEPVSCPAVPWVPPGGRDVVVVTRRVAAVVAALRANDPGCSIETELAAHVPPAGSGAAVDLEPRILVADPEGWHAAWPLFTALRRSSPIVIVDAEAADLRALLGHRTPPPPLGAGEAWLVEPGEPVRRRRWEGIAAG